MDLIILDSHTKLRIVSRSVPGLATHYPHSNMPSSCFCFRHDFTIIALCVSVIISDLIFSMTNARCSSTYIHNQIHVFVLFIFYSNKKIQRLSLLKYRLHKRPTWQPLWLFYDRAVLTTVFVCLFYAEFSVQLWICRVSVGILESADLCLCIKSMPIKCCWSDYMLHTMNETHVYVIMYMNITCASVKGMCILNVLVRSI